MSKGNEPIIVFVGTMSHRVCSTYLSTGDVHTCCKCKQKTRGCYIVKPLMGDATTMCRDCVLKK